MLWFEIKDYFKTLLKDFKMIKFLPLKFTYFLHGFSMLFIFPFMETHMTDFGFSDNEKLAVVIVLTFIRVLVPPIGGIIADCRVRFKILQVSLCVLGGLGVILLTAVPVERDVIFYPSDIVLGFGCPKFSPPMLTISQDPNCHLIQDVTNLNLQLQSCGVGCKVSSHEEVQAVLKAKSYRVGMEDPNTGTIFQYVYQSVSPPNTSKIVEKYQATLTTLWNNDRYFDTIRKLSKRTYYFPTTHLYHFSCYNKEENIADCILGSMDNGKVKLDKLKNFGVGVQIQTVNENQPFFWVNYLHIDNDIRLNCLDDDLFKKNNGFVEVYYKRNETRRSPLSFTLTDCSLNCVVNTTRSKICSNMVQVEIDRTSVTFWSYLAIMCFLIICFECSFSMFQGSVIMYMRTYRGRFGLQVMYSSLGSYVGQELITVLLDSADTRAYTDIRPLLFVSCLSNLLLASCLIILDVNFKSRNYRIEVYFINLFKNVKLLLILAVSIITGTIWAVNEHFFKLMLMELNPPADVLYQIRLITAFLPILTFLVSSFIIKVVGHQEVISLGLSLYGCRLLGYSLIVNPYHALYLEVLEAIGSSLTFAATITYAGQLTSVFTDMTVQSILGVMHFGIGKIIGRLLGAILVEKCGLRETFQIFSLVTLVFTVIFFIIVRFILKKDEEPKPEEGIAEEALNSPPGGCNATTKV